MTSGPYDPAQGASPLEPWVLGEIRAFLEDNPPRSTIQRITGRSLVPVDPDLVDTDESRSSSTYGDLTTVGPSQSGLPPGKYIFLFSARIYVVSTGAGIAGKIALCVNGVADDSTAAVGSGVSPGYTACRFHLVELTADDNTVKLQYAQVDNTTVAHFARRSIACIRYSD